MEEHLLTTTTNTHNGRRTVFALLLLFMCHDDSIKLIQIKCSSGVVRRSSRLGCFRQVGKKKKVLQPLLSDGRSEKESNLKVFPGVPHRAIFAEPTLCC